jgi:hypothetical protein
MTTPSSTVLSPSVRAQLDTPREIAWSMPKLVVRTVIAAAFGLLFLWAAWKLIVIGKADPDKIGYWFALVAGLVLGFLSLQPTLSAWRGRATGQPAVSISKAGLTFSGQPLIAWDMIAENIWHTMYAGGFLPLFSEIRIRGADGPIPVLGKVRYVTMHGGYHRFDATLFQCSSKKYLDYCNLYQAASQQDGV